MDGRSRFWTFLLCKQRGTEASGAEQCSSGRQGRPVSQTGSRFALRSAGVGMAPTIHPHHHLSPPIHRRSWHRCPFRSSPNFFFFDSINFHVRSLRISEPDRRIWQRRRCKQSHVCACRTRVDHNHEASGLCTHHDCPITHMYVDRSKL